METAPGHRSHSPWLLWIILLSFITAGPFPLAFSQNERQDDGPPTSPHYTAVALGHGALPDDDNAHRPVLVVVNMENHSPRWFLFHHFHIHRLDNPPATLAQVDALVLSPDRRHLAVRSVGEGHPIMQLLHLPSLLAGQKSTPLLEIDPYPGTIRPIAWNGRALQIESDMLLTHGTGPYGRVPQALVLYKPGLFLWHAHTGRIEALTPELKDPTAYYGKALTRAPFLVDPHRELEALAELGGPRALAYLRQALDIEAYAAHHKSIKALITK